MKARTGAEAIFVCGAINLVAAHAWDVRENGLQRNPPLAALIEMIDGAVAVLAADGTIDFANSSLTQLASQRQILRVDKASKLCFCDASAQSKFRAALAETCTKGQSGTPVSTLSAGTGSNRLTVVLTPFPAEQDEAAGAGRSGRALLILCATGSKPCLEGSVLRLHYQLSAAETAIVLGLTDGRNVSEVAAKLGISVTTARNQLAAAMTKMGVRRQAEVVSAISALTPRLHIGSGNDRSS